MWTPGAWCYRLSTSLTGIRSFGPGEEQKAVIKFGSPLTIITGQNGAGKTVSVPCHMIII